MMSDLVGTGPSRRDPRAFRDRRSQAVIRPELWRYCWQNTTLFLEAGGNGMNPFGGCELIVCSVVRHRKTSDDDRSVVGQVGNVNVLAGSARGLIFG